MLPYFEERKSEVAIFRQRVRGGCHNKLRFEKKTIALVWLTSSEIWLIPLVDKIFWGGGKPLVTM